MRDIKRHTIVQITTVEAADKSRPTSHRSPGHWMRLYAACACRAHCPGTHCHWRGDFV